MLPNSPSKCDQDARALRERFELVVLGDDDRAIAEAARALFWFCADRPEYQLLRLHPIEDPAAAPSEAKRIESQFESRCKGCRVLIVPGQSCLWTPGEKGVSCLACGGSR
jgi:hypothetical protein